MALTDIQKVRIEVADTDPALPILADEEYQYFLEKNNSSVVRASLDAARTILFRLSIDSQDQIVDVLALKGHYAADQYRQALQLFLKDPNLNPVLKNAGGYVGGISKTDMDNNNTNLDNVTVKRNDTYIALLPHNGPFEVYGDYPLVI